MRLPRIVSALILTLGACAGNRPAPALRASPADVWVDASALEPGDGSDSKPWKSLRAALTASQGPRRLHLRTGLYPGPFELGPGVELVGHGAVVLYVEGDEAVVSASAPVSLEALTLQGGAGGRFDAGVHLARVEIAGAKPTSLHLAGGHSELEDVTLTASFSEVIGLQLEAGAEARCSRCVIQGPYRRGVNVDGEAAFRFEDSRMEGPVTGLQLVSGSAVLERSHLANGRGPALFASSGVLTLSDVSVWGHEYALLARGTSQVHARSFTAVRSQRAAIGIVGSTADLRSIWLTDTGDFGGLQVVGGQVSLSDFWIAGHGVPGVMARQGELRLTNGIITGGGIELRNIHARLEGLAVRDSPVSCLLASEFAEVEVVDASFERCRVSGMEAEGLARIHATSLWVRHIDGAAFAVPGKARLVVDTFEVSDATTLIWADCEQGASAVLSRGRINGVDSSPAACVKVSRGAGE